MLSTAYGHGPRQSAALRVFTGGYSVGARIAGEYHVTRHDLTLTTVRQGELSLASGDGASVTSASRLQPSAYILQRLARSQVAGAGWRPQRRMPQPTAVGQLIRSSESMCPCFSVTLLGPSRSGHDHPTSGLGSVWEPAWITDKVVL